MPDSDSYERTWLIDQYLTGRLDDDLQEQVEQRRRTDPAFEQHVVAQSLIASYLEKERATAEFYQAFDQLTSKISEQRGNYKNHKVIRFLPQLLTGVLAACLLLWLSLPPAGQTGRLPVLPFDPDGLGFGSIPIVVVRYTHAPGLLGKLRTTEQYRWPADTLFLYGTSLVQQPVTGWKLEQTNLPSLYRLSTNGQTYLVRRGQTEQTDLYSYETR